MADAITRLATTLPADLPHTVRVWFAVDSTVDMHLLHCIARQPLHKSNTPKKAQNGGYVAFSPIYACLALI